MCLNFKFQKKVLFTMEYNIGLHIRSKRNKIDGIWKCNRSQTNVICYLHSYNLSRCNGKSEEECLAVFNTSTSKYHVLCHGNKYLS